MKESLGIAEFAMAVAGLVATLWRPSRREVVIAVALSAWIAFSAISIMEARDRHARLLKIEGNIEMLLREHSRTVDQLHEELHYVPFTEVTEALYNAVDAGHVTHRVIELKNADGSLLRVRVYSAAADS